ncbi:MAG TPA: hypothetical protein VH061_02815 [Solirubrobacteraceae bacterium]|jgi:hypothetical protein|nr:hypothetical protein [Solirubrobacteraceae bacterium]
MYRRRAKRRTLVAELRMVAIRIGLAMGIAGATWYGIDHPGHEAGCAVHGDRLRTCVDHAAGALVEHWALIFGAGLMLGAIGGLALALMIPGPVRSRV